MALVCVLVLRWRANCSTLPRVTAKKAAKGFILSARNAWGADKAMVHLREPLNIGKVHGKLEMVACIWRGYGQSGQRTTHLDPIHWAAGYGCAAHSSATTLSTCLRDRVALAAKAPVGSAKTLLGDGALYCKNQGTLNKNA